MRGERGRNFRTIRIFTLRQCFHIQQPFQLNFVNSYIIMITNRLFKSYSRIMEANDIKLRAAKREIDVIEFITAADALEKCHHELNKELQENEKLSPYSKYYGQLYSQLVLFHSYDCLYNYHKIINNFTEAELFLTKAQDAISNINTDHTKIKTIAIENSNNYNARELEEINITIKYELLFINLKKEEYIAKVHFDKKTFFEAAKKYQITLNYAKKLTELVELNKNILGTNKYITCKVNYFILSINFSQALMGSYEKYTFEKNEYFIIASLEHLVTSIEAGNEIINIRNTTEYKDKLSILMKNLKEFLSINTKYWDVIIDRFRDKPLITETAKDLDLEKFNSIQLPKTKIKYIIVFIIHGFNTRGTWKQRLANILSRQFDNVRFIIEEWDYGTFKLQFFSRSARHSVVNSFKKFFNERLTIHGDIGETACVAHSFGTYIISENIKKFPEVNFDKILLVGSIIRRDFDWLYIHTKHPNCRVRLELHKADQALKLANLYSKTPFGKWLGDSGRKGFDKDYTFIQTSFYEYSDHSDMFGEQHMLKNWVPFLQH